MVTFSWKNGSKKVFWLLPASADFGVVWNSSTCNEDLIGLNRSGYLSALPESAGRSKPGRRAEGDKFPPIPPIIGLL